MLGLVVCATVECSLAGIKMASPRAKGSVKSAMKRPKAEYNDSVTGKPRVALRLLMFTVSKHKKASFIKKMIPATEIVWLSVSRL